MKTLFELAFAYMGAFGAKALVETGILEAISSSKLSTDAIAERCHLPEEKVVRLLRDLHYLDLYHEEAGFYNATEKGKKVLKEKDWLSWLTRENIENLWDAIEQADENKLLTILTRAVVDQSHMLEDALNTLALHLLVRFGLHRHIPVEGISVKALAEKTHHAEALLNLILKPLVAQGVVKLGDGKVFSTKLLTALPKLEKVAVGEARMKWVAPTYLAEMLRKKSDAYTLAYGMPIFDYFKHNTHERKLLDGSMADTTAFENQLIADTLKLGDETDVVDIGGGNGTFLSTFLEKNTALSGAVFDLEQSLTGEEVSKHFHRFGSRFRTIPGNFFKPETIPPMNCAFIKRVLHDWSDADALKILRHLAAKCKHVFVIEWLFDGGKFMSCVDLLLMCINGKLRTEEEFRKILTEAGFSTLPRRAFSDDFSLGYVEAHSMSPALQEVLRV